MIIKAIETRYAGCHFRSRLEARWAVFFDAAGIAWEYEPEGFESEHGRYLPDFYLPDTGTWVEVKGTNEAAREALCGLEMFLDFDSALPGMQESNASDRGLLLLGPIPRVDAGMSTRRVVTHQIVQHHKGLLLNDWSFQVGPSGGLCAEWNEPFDASEIDIENFRTLKLDDDLGNHAGRVVAAYAAYAAARSARFEHGQSGAT